MFLRIRALMDSRAYGQIAIPCLSRLITVARAVCRQRHSSRKIIFGASP